MLNQDAPAEITNRHPNHHFPLKDHDYCSPNKRKPDQVGEPGHKLSNKDLDQSSDLKNKASTSSDLPGTPITSTIKPTRSNSDENLSDSSSSSSSVSSSVSSNKNLVIAQETTQKHTGPIASKETPFVKKRRVGRPSKQDSMEGTQATSAQVRSKRPRQSTSVTDKSEWIMGDDQIDSVLSEHLDDNPSKKRRHSSRDSDQAFEDGTSSDYSSSTAESDDDSEYNSEDDPDKLWCICRKPHDGKFMICCDICKDWFHGHCVGVTKLMGDRFEKEGKEWFCMECSDKLRAGIPRSAIPTKMDKKEKKKKKKKNKDIPSTGKRGRGRPKKSDIAPREISTRSSQRNLRKSLDSKLGVDNGRLKRNLSRSDVRTESFDEFEDSQRLKVLIKERKKEFFYKRQLAEQQKAARRDELGLGRRALTGNLSDSLDSLASSTNTPNMNNLPINIKSEHSKERSKPNIVLQINTKKESGPHHSNPRIVTAIVRPHRKSSHTEPTTPTLNDLFTADPIQIGKKVKTQEASPTKTATNEVTGSNSDKRHSPSGVSKSEKSAGSTDQISESTTPKRKRKDSDSIANGNSSSPAGSKHIAQKIRESLEARSKQIKEVEVPTDKIEILAVEIEAQLNECFKESTLKYMNKFRSLIFNLRDPKNQCLVTNVLIGEISPAKLVRMSPDEMASNELAKWRERENKHSIELIKRDAQLAAQQVIVKKTHKGEEVITAPSLNDPDDSSVEVNSQEPPTTPTKQHPSKEQKSDGSSKQKTATSNSKLAGITSLKRPVKPEESEVKETPAPVSDPPLFLDTTRDHKSHVFDINCKICSKHDISESQEPSTDSQKEKERRDSESEQQEQPKRFRVTIDTKLDPANLSRLKEPLIKPVDHESTELDGYNSMSPTEEQQNSNEGSDYDGEFPPGLEDIASPKVSSDPSWTGTITMPDIAKFNAKARPVEGDVNFLRDEISQDLMVCGRIAPDQVQGYIKKLKATTKNQILTIQIFPLNSEDKVSFDTLFDYLYSRNRYGVIQTSPQVLKDFYILPVHERSSVPEVLRPGNGTSINRDEPNCLLGLLVRGKRAAQTSSTTPSSYTPTPIK